jgi:ElaB/YqjD/DUF883 family membrane-anchored ribosome-binding protein
LNRKPGRAAFDRISVYWVLSHLPKEDCVSEEGHAYDGISDDVADLQDDVSALADELEGTATDAMKRTLRRIEESVSDIYELAAEQGGRGVEALERQIDERPWTSVLVAFGLGCLIGKLTSRRR